MVDTGLIGKISNIMKEKNEICEKLTKDKGKDVNIVKGKMPQMNGFKVDIDFDEKNGSFEVKFTDYGNYADINYENILADVRKKLKK